VPAQTGGSAKPKSVPDLPVTYYLMLISIEGPVITDIRDGTAEEEAQLASLTEKAYAIWQRKPRRIWTEHILRLSLDAGLPGYCVTMYYMLSTIVRPTLTFMSLAMLPY
jgi:hypothetical protein